MRKEISSSSNLKAWTWATLSVGLLTATYLVLYAPDIFSFGKKLPSYLRSQRSTVTAKRWAFSIWWALKVVYRSAISILETLLFLAWLAAIGVALWGVCTKTELPIYGKVLISLIVFVGMSILGLMFLGFVSEAKSKENRAIKIVKFLFWLGYFVATGFAIWAVCTKSDTSLGARVGIGVVVGIFLSFVALAIVSCCV